MVQEGEGAHLPAWVREGVEEEEEVGEGEGGQALFAQHSVCNEMRWTQQETFLPHRASGYMCTHYQLHTVQKTRH